MKLWTPWVEETKQVINKTARWIFAALALTFLVLANIAAVVVIVNQIAKLTK